MQFTHPTTSPVGIPCPKEETWKQKAPALALWSTIYTLVSWLTSAAFLGDTRAYTSSILDFNRGQIQPFWQDNALWEFGHLLWRPAGWVVFRAAYPMTSMLVGTDPRHNIVISLFALNWIAGLICLLLLRSMLRALAIPSWTVNLVSLAFLFSQTILNFSHTGTPYIPGLMFLFLSVYELSSDSFSRSGMWLAMIVAGAGFAAAVCLWCLYVLAFPVVALAPFLSGTGSAKSRLRLGVLTCAVAGLLTICAYGLVLAHLHLYRWHDIHAWISASSHGVDNIKGLPRTVFGFARSFINMGRDGVFFKRFLYHDRYNPVSFVSLLRVSLGKFLLFYALLILVLMVLLRSHNYKLLAVLAISAIPVMGFALFWQGGDMERYLPLYPVLFVVLALSLSARPSPGWYKAFATLLVAVMIVNNGHALWKSRVEHNKQVEEDRIGILQPVLKPGSQVILLDHELEEVANDPERSSMRQDVLRTYTIVVVGSMHVLRWRQDFASVARSAWDHQGDVWISNKILNPRPAPDLNWVEGDDRRISWDDVHQFFARVEIGPSVGGADGFALMPASPRNIAFFQGLSGESAETQPLDFNFVSSNFSMRILPSARGHEQFSLPMVTFLVR